MVVKKKIFLVLAFLLVVGLGCKICCFHNNSLLYMSNDKVKVGILPNSGGRVVLFKLHGRKNILKSVPELWKRKFPKPEIQNADVDFFGHIVWVGPQKEWWTQQDLLPNKKARRSDWPPDPFTIYARYDILEQSSTNVLMTAPPSPVTGLQITKQFILNGNNLTLITTAENKRTEPVSWNLWSNTRLDPENKVYIPVSGTNDVKRLEPGWQSPGIYMPYIITNSYFMYDIALQPTNDFEKKWSTKAFINPAKQQFKTVLDDSIFIKEMSEDVEVENIHTNHAPVELFIAFEPEKSNLMELEFHGEYKTLEHGESIQLIEKWTLIPKD